MNKKINWIYLAIELLVVFLGITAGFFLQNYKDRVTKTEKEKNYLVGFIKDVESNIINLEEQILSDSIWVEKNKYAAKLMITDSLSFDSANAIVKTMVVYSRYMPQTDTYENILNSGSLDIISDYDLKQMIVAYHKSLDDFELLESYFHDYYRDIFMPYIMQYYDILNQKFCKPDSHRSINFKNNFVGNYSLRQQRVKGYGDLLKQSRELLNKLTER